jgi:dihydrofolate reductase
MPTTYAFIAQTLDGYYEGPNGEFDWPNVDDEFNEFAIAQLDATEMLLFGRRTYEGMAAYWPSEEGMRDDPEIAGRMNDVPKVVFSTTLDAATWNNTRLVRENTESELKAIQRGAQKDLGVFGSIDLTGNLLNMGLLDELRILVNPIILGAGHSLLAGVGRRVPLTHVDTRTFASGNVLLTYRPQM